MRLPIKGWAGEGEKRKMVDAVLWIDEVPPEYRRGKNKSAKRRQHKQRSYERQRRGD